MIDDIRASYSSGDIDDKGHKSKNTLADLLGVCDVARNVDSS